MSFEDEVVDVASADAAGRRRRRGVVEVMLMALATMLMLELVVNDRPTFPEGRIW